MALAFLNGWGLAAREVEELFLERFLRGDVVLVQPDATWVDGLEKALRLGVGESTLVAYSTGAFLALSREDLMRRFDRVILLAPFVDFRFEAGLGGRVKAAQLKYLRRWLERDPLAAANDFRQRAGFGGGLEELPNSVENLLWGVDRLIEGPLRSNCPKDGYEAFIGELDPLLDAWAVASALPRTRILEEVGHELAGLLEHLELGVGA